tara:strand:+ start:182 stop:1021 length:840 start_codon:yes stop_codon:yes gene_type:complete
MDTIIGLGNAGCQIAEKLSNYPQYKIYKLDVGLTKKKGNYPLPELSTPEEYDALELKLGNFFKGVTDDILFVVAGSGMVSNASLAILKHLRSRRVSILYIRPDLELLQPQSIPWLSERAVFGILQEFTRSGLFAKMWIVSNPHVEAVIGDVPVIGYYDKINDMIVTTFHMMNVMRHTKPIIENRSTIPIACRIGTFGLTDMENRKKMFYPLDDVSDGDYIYCVEREILENDGSLLKRINKMTKEVNHRAYYGVYASKYEGIYVYLEQLTSRTQNNKEIA